MGEQRVSLTQPEHEAIARTLCENVRERGGGDTRDRKRRGRAGGGGARLLLLAGLLEVGAAVVEAVAGGSLGTTSRRAIAQIATTGPDTKKTARQPEEARTPAAIALATTPPKILAAAPNANHSAADRVGDGLANKSGEER